MREQNELLSKPKKKWIEYLKQISGVFVPLLIVIIAFFWELLDRIINLERKMDLLIDDTGKIRPSIDAVLAQEAINRLDNSLDKLINLVLNQISKQQCL